MRARMCAIIGHFSAGFDVVEDDKQIDVRIRAIVSASDGTRENYFERVDGTYNFIDDEWTSSCSVKPS